MRAAALATLVVVGGCELIADIPSSNASRSGDDGSVGEDGGSGGDAAPQPECATNPECTTATEPICGADRQCRACYVDADCGTNGVCMLDGACAAPARIMYAATTGGGTTCSPASPCSLDQAVSMLAATRDVVKLAPGTYDRPVTLAIAASIPVLLAGEGATIRNTTTQMYAFTWTSNGPDVGITGATFEHNGKFGSECLGGKLTLSRVTQRGAAIGFYAAASCDVTFERTVWINNNLYAISMPANSSTLHVRNSLIANNGVAGGMVSPIILSDAALQGVIENTTIANNVSDAQPSVNCANAFTLRNVISFGNTAPPSSMCVATYSDLEAGYGGANSHDVTIDPKFASATDYHLQPTSPVRGLGDPANVVPLDIDFQSRPQPAGAAPDLGYDEVP